MLEPGEFRRLVRQALTALSRFGVLQDDTEVDNFHLTDGRVAAVDLEMMELVLYPPARTGGQNLCSAASPPRKQTSSN